MKNFLILFIISLFLINCNKGTDNNFENEGLRPKIFTLQVVIKKDGVFSEEQIINPSNIDRENPSKYKVVYEELDDVGVKVMHINEGIGGYMYLQIRPYGSNFDKNQELIGTHTKRKFRLTLYEEDKILLSKVITITAEGYWEYRELKVDNMDYVENFRKYNGNSLTFNLAMKK